MAYPFRAILSPIQFDDPVIASLGLCEKHCQGAGGDASPAARGGGWRVHRFGLFSFRLCANGAFAGYSGIKHTAIDDAELIELAHAVPSVLWRSGYATEMSQAAVRFAFEARELKLAARRRAVRA